MNDTARQLPTDFFWRESQASGESHAIGHAWVEFKREDGAVVVKANGREALRFTIKYRESGPYLAVEMRDAGRTGETMGACLVAGEMAQRYADILEAHNKLGERLHSARSFLISPEERERAALKSAEREVKP